MAAMLTGKGAVCCEFLMSAMILILVWMLSQLLINRFCLRWLAGTDQVMAAV